MKSGTYEWTLARGVADFKATVPGRDANVQKATPARIEQEIFAHNAQAPDSRILIRQRKQRFAAEGRSAPRGKQARGAKSWREDGPRTSVGPVEKEAPRTRASSKHSTPGVLASKNKWR